MTRDNRHIIQRQVWQLEVAGFNDSNELQREMSNRNRDILESIEEVFSELSTPDQIIRFDRLEVDLGSFQKDVFFDQLKKRLSVQLKETVLDNIPSSSQSYQETSARVSFNDVDENTSPGKPARVINDAQRTELLLRFFFQKGYLPWWSRDEEFPDIGALMENFIQGADKSILTSFFNDLLKDNKVGGRVISNLTDQAKIKLLEKLAASPVMAMALPDLLYQLIILTKGEERGTFSVNERKKLLHEIWIAVLLPALSVSSDTEVIYQSLKRFYLNSSTPYIVSARKSSFQSFLNTLNIVVKKLQDPPEELISHVEGSENLTVARRRIFDLISKTKTVSGTGRRMLSAEDSEEKKDFQPGETIEEAIPCKNAGLILLWPYLSGLFKRLGWVEDKHFVSEMDRIKAVWLLHYMATGERAGEEYHLVLNKLLCGMSPEDPVEKPEEFIEETLKIADELLETVIDNWTVLKSTSIDGLRKSFLSRSGLLYLQDEKYLLKIERTGIDVLIDRLPYGLNMIVLPWRKDIMTCEW